MKTTSPLESNLTALVNQEYKLNLEIVRLKRLDLPTDRVYNEKKDISIAIEQILDDIRHGRKV